MLITYKPLLKLLVENNLRKHDLVDLIGLSTATIAKFSADEYVSLSVIEKLCKYFNCQPNDIFLYVSTKNEEDSNESGV